MNDPVNFVDLWGLQCKSENDEKVGSNEGYEELPKIGGKLILLWKKIF